MKTGSLAATVGRQLRSRSRASSYWVGATAPVLLIGVLLYQTGKATSSPATLMFLAILSSLWVGGSANVREIVDERKLVQREPHLSLLAYGAAKILHAILLAAGQSAILGLLVQMSGVVWLPFYQVWTVLFLTTVAGSLLALVLSALCDEAATALAWFPLVLVPQVVFGGFLFPFGDTKPFDLNSATGQVTVMPEALVREPVRDPVLRAAGAVAVSRWALETYAALAFEQDLASNDSLQEAIQVSFFVPLSLSDVAVADRLLTHLNNRSTGQSLSAPKIDAESTRYLLVLVLFVACQALMLLVALPLRDPRRS
jgi:hypothetical protein